MQPNKHGVYSKEFAERFFVEFKKTKAEIYLLQVDGLWIQAESICDSLQGFSSPLTMHETFKEKQAAFTASIERLKRHGATKEIVNALYSKYTPEKYEQYDMFA